MRRIRSYGILVGLSLSVVVAAAQNASHVVVASGTWHVNSSINLDPPAPVCVGLDQRPHESFGCSVHEWSLDVMVEGRLIQIPRDALRTLALVIEKHQAAETK